MVLLLAKGKSLFSSSSLQSVMVSVVVDSLRSRGHCFLAWCVALRVVCVAGCSGLFFEYRDVVLHVFSADRLGGGCWLRSAGGFTRRVGGDRHFRKSDIKLGSGVSIS